MIIHYLNAVHLHLFQFGQPFEFIFFHHSSSRKQYLHCVDMIGRPTERTEMPCILAGDYRRVKIASEPVNQTSAASQYDCRSFFLVNIMRVSVQPFQADKFKPRTLTDTGMPPE